MAGEGIFPKSDGDVLYDTDVNILKYGSGDGSDGAFNETSGTTNLTQGTIYQYTSFNLGASATISASSTSKSPMIILVQGDATISGTIDLTGKGAAATEGYGADSVDVGNTQIYVLGGAGNHPWATNGGSGGHKMLISNLNISNQITFFTNGTGGGHGSQDSAGAGCGGGGGASASNNGAAGGNGNGTLTDGNGAAGGCTLIMIVGGNLTLDASATITLDGADGGAGTDTNHGGGGGGGSGDLILLYGDTLTNNGPTISTSGGSGGAGNGTGANGGTGGNGTNKILKMLNTFFVE